MALFRRPFEHFRRDLHSQDSVSGILSVSRRYIAELNLFRTFAFWTVNPVDYGFEFTLAAPEAESSLLKQIVAAQIKVGRFAFALRQDAPVFFHFGDGPAPERAACCTRWRCPVRSLACFAVCWKPRLPLPRKLP